ncbi:MAG: PTS system mannose/fructose/sorbose family transporter subunit IID [Myxococcaceae bacterium]
MTGELSSFTLFRVFMRSLFLQASWNPQGMQNLGLAYALYPALKELYPDPEKQMAAVRRHLVFFNTHPYVAAAIVGGVLFHEQKIARGEERDDRVVAFKAALMGPLAALGDGFFWLSLKPAVGALCAALVPIMSAWAALLFLVLYNAVHFWLRAKFYFMGLRHGDRLVEEVARARLPQRGARLRLIAAVSAGGLAANLAVVFGLRHSAEYGLWLAAGCLLVGGLSYLLVARRVPNHVLLFLAAALAVGAGALL